VLKPPVSGFAGLLAAVPHRHKQLPHSFQALLIRHHVALWVCRHLLCPLQAVWLRALVGLIVAGAVLSGCALLVALHPPQTHWHVLLELFQPHLDACGASKALRSEGGAVQQAGSKVPIEQGKLENEE
jgi:hypothetical protein